MDDDPFANHLVLIMTEGEKMELRNLKTFHVVAEQLNMTKTAKILGYTQPTITLQIQVLEKELNHTLFTRVGKKTFLTPAGKKLKQHTDTLFTVIQQLESDLDELRGPSGTLAVAASEYYCSHHLALIINSYIKLHPQVKLKLVPSNSLAAIEKVLNHEADIGIIAHDCDFPDIERQILNEERAVLVVSSEIFNNNCTEQIFSDYPFLSYYENSSFEELTTQCFSELNYQPAVVIECGGSEETIRRAVLNHTGIALMGEKLIKEELATGLLVPLHYCTKRIENSVIYLKNRAEEATIQSFTDLLQEAWNAVTE